MYYKTKEIVIDNDNETITIEAADSNIYPPQYERSEYDWQHTCKFYDRKIEFFASILEGNFRLEAGCQHYSVVSRAKKLLHSYDVEEIFEKCFAQSNVLKALKMNDKSLETSYSELVKIIAEEICVLGKRTKGVKETTDKVIENYNVKFLQLDEIIKKQKCFKITSASKNGNFVEVVTSTGKRYIVPEEAYINPYGLVDCKKGKCRYIRKEK